MKVKLKWEKRPGKDNALIARYDRSVFEIYPSHDKICRAIIHGKNGNYGGDAFFSGPTATANVESCKNWAEKQLVKR